MTAPPRTLQERLRNAAASATEYELEVYHDHLMEAAAALDAQSQLLAEADEAIWQALDDMGDSHCVCEDTKQQLRAVNAKLKAASGEG